MQCVAELVVYFSTQYTIITGEITRHFGFGQFIVLDRVAEITSIFDHVRHLFNRIAGIGEITRCFNYFILLK